MGTDRYPHPHPQVADQAGRRPPTTVWQVAWRWRWLVLVVAVVSLGGSLTLALRRPLYGTEVRALVQPMLPDEDLILRSRYPQGYLRMQFVQRALVDLADYVESRGFAAGVAERHAEQLGIRPPLGTVAGALSAQKVHRTLRIGVVTGAAESTYRIAMATATELELHGAAFAADEAGQPKIEVAVITDPAPPRRQTPWRGVVVALLRTLGVIVVLLVVLRVVAGHRRTLDTTGEATVLLGLPVLSTVPGLPAPRGLPSVRWRWDRGLSRVLR
ncbi:MAG: hypothetical protein CL878_10700 [Dehalococcoidia bacterium]|nr:hypothetical protein [Dehalococcoidia bacterium]